jgi:hypothetical protein
MMRRLELNAEENVVIIDKKILVYAAISGRKFESIIN